MGKDWSKEPVIIDGPALDQASAEYIGTPRFWQDLHAQIKGQRLESYWTRRSGEGQVAYSWGPEGRTDPVHPPMEVLTRGLCAAARAGTSVPTEMLDYIDGRLDGTIKPKEGRPKGKSTDTIEEERVLARRVSQVRWLCEASPKYRTEVECEPNGFKGKRGALKRALEQVARESGKKESTLKSYYQRHRGWIAIERLREADNALRSTNSTPPPETDPARDALARERAESLRRQAARSGR